MSTASTKSATLVESATQEDYKAGFKHYLAELGKILRRMQTRRERLEKKSESRIRSSR